MSHYETHELHKNVDLRTHWYNCSYDNIKNAIMEAADYLGYDVENINDHYKEFFFIGPAELIVTICSHNAYEHGVDLALTNNWAFDFGKGKRQIIQFYERVNKKANLKGVSLHP